jgi:hypothetical protein
MKKKADLIVLILFSIAVTIAGISAYISAKATELRFGQPLIDKHGEVFVLTVEYGAGHYFVACFDKAEEMQAFAALGNVYTKAGLK